MAIMKEAQKVAGNSGVGLLRYEREWIGADIGDYVIKSMDINKKGQKYIALYKPTTKEDLALVKKHQNMWGGDK